MQPYMFSLLGLVLDIFGAFLLAVEAIKLENFKALREAYLLPAHKLTIPPTITFIREESPETKKQAGSAGLFIFAYGLAHVLAGAATVWFGTHMLEKWGFDVWAMLALWFGDLSTASKVGVAILLAWVSLGLLWGVGELWHICLIKGTKLLVVAVESIEKNSPSGVIGILGFALLAFGFALQFYGTWASRPIT